MTKTKKALYTGLYSDSIKNYENAIHHPLIKIIPIDKNSPDIQFTLSSFHKYTHVIFTSKSAVEIFVNFLSVDHASVNQKNVLKNKIIISVGKATTNALTNIGITVSHTAEEESSEGVVEMLKRLDLSEAFVLWPHSALSRRIIPDYFNEKKISLNECTIYHTQSQILNPVVNLDDFEEIIFTSPSTIDAFIQNFNNLPSNKKYTCIGPVTKKYLLSLQKY